MDVNDARQQTLDLVGNGQVVLHVGCGNGSLARSLVERQCRVSGIEMNRDLAHRAADYLDMLVAADIDEEPLTTHFKPESFDVVLIGNVLGQLRDPVTALRDAATLLSPSGRIVVSVTNSAHGSARLALLQGTVPPSPSGLTRDTLCDLLAEARLDTAELVATLKDPLDGLEIPVDRIPPTVVEWVRHQPGALEDRYLASARPLAADASPGRRPRVRAAVPHSSVRAVDEHTFQMRAEQHERHRLLTLRDHVIGLEAALATARERAAQAESRSRLAQGRAHRLRQELNGLAADIERMVATRPRPSRQDVRNLLARARLRTSRGKSPT